MPRTILEIAREAAERDATAPPPSTLFGTNNRIARTLRNAAKDTLREYMRRCGSSGLSEFHSTWVFSIIPGRFTYQMPPDFLRAIPHTEGRFGWDLSFLGPATPQVWANWLLRRSHVTASMGWRIKNGVLFIDPVPRETALVSFEYISNYPVVSEIREGDYDLNADPINTIAPLVPRDGFLDVTDSAALNEMGASSSFEYGEGEGYDDAEWDEGPFEILRRIDPNSEINPLPQVRRPEFTQDDDMPAFVDDYALSLGMTYRLRRALSKPYAEHAAEYEAELDAKESHDAGGARGFSLGRSGQCHGAVPLGAGKWMVS
ncbi:MULTISPECIES: hypothetical protein [Halocynthiibacter]|uniref:Uncharacterized protein n=1 Tax=Halocynthiibacter halioticoli TaxID=2986804 RepID=A0AAE3LSW1_9RHOB|nr:MULTISPECIES: hypothetical protein [Halocynthiibacter]MCV6826004.1 hypothetical protein [Halocynthiibacter halioticoli]MCW4059005.1 hypothetical protein [Halocynthiibacter sp. SDUM655004]